MRSSGEVARFEAERQALALMDHPHIARVFDGGATDRGRPFFVMELVRGVPISRYCDEAMLHPGDRLQLFQRVCEAVQHAHQKGVIHRDLKPSNVLVTLHDGRPVPKVIDFGIAKATHGQLTDRTVFTGFQQMLGTPEYMAPEQAEMSGLDVDTRADIYSLGVLLYELLTGTKPFELKDALLAGYQEMLRRIREVDPDKPSTRISTLGARLLDVCKHRRVHPRVFGRLMRGDLDWIVLKALEKERSRRYATAESLAADLERHLRHQPVEAGPPSRLFKLRKYVRRHRVGVVAGLAIVASLAVGAVMSRMGYAEAKEQEARAFAAARQARDQEEAAVLARQQESEQRQREARREAEKTGRVVRLLENLLGSSDPGRGKGKDYTVRQLLADFDRDLQGVRDLDPEVEATLRDVIGDSYLGLNLPEKAEPHVRRGLALRQEFFGEHSLEHRISLSQLAQWHFQTSNTDRTRTTEHLNASVALLEKALESPDRSSPEGRLWFAAAAHDIALSLRYLGRLGEAQDWLQQMLE